MEGSRREPRRHASQGVTVQWKVQGGDRTERLHGPWCSDRGGQVARLCSHCILSLLSLAQPPEAMSGGFEDLGLLPELVRATQDQGWLLPSDIQDEAIPLILGGGDVMAVRIFSATALEDDDVAYSVDLPHRPPRRGAGRPGPLRCPPFRLRTSTGEPDEPQRHRRRPLPRADGRQRKPGSRARSSASMTGLRCSLLRPTGCRASAARSATGRASAAPRACCRASSTLR